MTTDPTKMLGQRIAHLRKGLHLKQADLAEKVGLGSPQIVSQIEKGEREVKAWELARLAEVLFVSVSDLLAPEEPEAAPAFLWRVLPSEESVRSLKEAKLLKRCEEYALLEDLSGTTRPGQFPQKKVDVRSVDFHTAARLAEDIRTEFGLGERPAASLEKTLEERYGVKIWYDELDEGSAAATIGRFGPAILMNRKQAPWRRNYNFAHELFHLITWDSIPAERLQKDSGVWERIEKLANSFASCLLLPAEMVRLEIEGRTVDNQVEGSDLIELARKFEVSTEALLYRLLNLKLATKESVESLLADEGFRRLDKSTMATQWWDPSDLPERFVRLAFVAYQKGRLSRARLAELLNSTLPDVTTTLLRYGLDDREIQKSIALRAA